MTDDEYLDQRLEDLVQRLRLLDDEPSGPTRVDLARAIAEARRRRRVRRMAVAGGTALTLAVIAAVPIALQAVRSGAPLSVATPANSAAAEATTEPGRTPTGGPPAGDPLADPAGDGGPRSGRSAEASRPTSPTRCVLEPLPVPGGHPMSLVTGADPTGRFILGRSYPPRHDGTYPTLIWDDGKATRVELPGSDQSLTDATTTGAAVGTGWTDRGPLPYLVRDGRVTRLPVAGAAEARAINDAGQIVGTRDSRQPVIWHSADSAPVDLRLPDPGWRGEAIDIDEDGTVVGVVHSDDGRTERGYVWFPDGTGRLLPDPPARNGLVATFRPRSIRNGWVTGASVRASLGANGESGAEESTAIRLHLATGRFVALPANDLWPQHGNDQGWAVGSSSDGRAVLLTDDRVLALPGLTDKRYTTANIAWRVSDDGRTVSGQSDNAKGDPQAVRWRCR